MQPFVPSPRQVRTVMLCRVNTDLACSATAGSYSMLATVPGCAAAMSAAFQPVPVPISSTASAVSSPSRSRVFSMERTMLGIEFDDVGKSLALPSWVPSENWVVIGESSNTAAAHSSTSLPRSMRRWRPCPPFSRAHATSGMNQSRGQASKAASRVAGRVFWARSWRPAARGRPLQRSGCPSSLGGCGCCCRQ